MSQSTGSGQNRNGSKSIRDINFQYSDVPERKLRHHLFGSAVCEQKTVGQEIFRNIVNECIMQKNRLRSSGIATCFFVREEYT